MKVHEDRVSRRDFLGTSSLLAASGLIGLGGQTGDAAEAKSTVSTPLLTPSTDFVDVSRGSPKPHTLKGEALVKARLTPETWRLEIVADPFVSEQVKSAASIGKALTLADGNAIDLPKLLELGKKYEVRFLKAMQCLNIPAPLGQGLWEGVPLRDLLRLVGKINNVRRIYYWGYHNDDPKQIFRSSLSYTQVMETPPGELPVFVAYRLNGEPLSLIRGGPVRMVVPWSHGFKSIKWLQQISLTNDWKSNDTYAEANNDPESHLKTAAYLDSVDSPIKTGQPVFIRGKVISGLSGLKRVEYWLRPAPENGSDLGEDDPAWEKAEWIDCPLDAAPSDWSRVLPKGVSSKEVLGFDKKTGQPTVWPLRYSMVTFSATLKGLTPGKYEIRARSVDLNDFAQPEPRPSQKSGRNPVQVKRFEVVKEG